MGDESSLRSRYFRAKRQPKPTADSHQSENLKGGSEGESGCKIKGGDVEAKSGGSGGGQIDGGDVEVKGVGGGHEPMKVLGILTALCCLLNNSSHDREEDPGKILTSLAVLAGVSAAPTAAAADCPRCKKRPRDEKGDDEEQNRLHSTMRIDHNTDQGSLGSFTPPPPPSKSSGGYSPSSSVKSTVLSQASITSLKSKPIHGHSPDESEFHEEEEEEEGHVVVLRRSIEHVQGEPSSVRESLKTLLLAKVEKVGKEQVTVESALETAASINLLHSLHGSSTEGGSPLLGDIAEQAREGAEMMQEGQKQEELGKKKLNYALNRIRELY